MKRARRRIRLFGLKGVSAVIAVLLMISITVIAALIAYSWVMGYFRTTSSKVSKTIQIPSAYYTGPNQYLSVYVQNVGQGKATLVGDQCLYVDGKLEGLAHIVPGGTSYTLQESETVMIVDQANLTLGQTIKIKVITTEGTSVEKYFTLNSFSGQNPFSLTVTVNTPSGGSCALNNSGPYNYGDVVQLTSTANIGWTFSAWGLDVSGSVNPTTITIDGIKTVTASFTQNDYALTLNMVGNGQVTKNPDQATYHYGDSVQLTAIADPGWNFSSWTGDLTSSTNPATVTIDETPIVTATFIQNQFIITASAGSGGSISPSGSVSVNSGADQTFTFLPNTGYHVSVLTVDGSTVMPIPVDYTFPAVTAAHTIDVQFSIDTFTITATAGANGQIIPSGNVIVNYDGSQTFTITANLDYHVADVLVDGVSVGAVTSYPFTHVVANHTISATFTPTLQVTFLGSGTGSGVASGNPTPAYPTVTGGLQANDLILLQVIARGDSPTITPPLGFTQLYAPESSATAGTQRVTQAIYYKFAAGGETGTVTVTITQPSTCSRGARMYAFRNVALSSFTEGASLNPNTAHSNTYAAQTVATSGARRLAVSFEAIGTNSVLDSFTGETPNPPYDWTMPGGSGSSTGWFNGAVGNSLFSLGIQTATMANQGTISGGTDPSNTCDWIVRSFALVPR